MGSKDMIFYPKNVITCMGKKIDLSVPKIMGIINVTPDSFYAKSRYDVHQVLTTCESMLKDGAMFVDVGGYSSRPGADHIAVDEEKRRTIPIIESIAHEFPELIISIDTFRSVVADSALDAGASIINDISGGELDEAMFELVASRDVPYILTHMRGTPQNMQLDPSYESITNEILTSLRNRLTILQTMNVSDVIIDPGFGFGKTLDQNYQLLSELSQFKDLKVPILVGLSRKSMIYKLLDSSPEEALNGTSVLHTISLQKGAQILRVHDVKDAAECIKLWSACANLD
jgi:dihydropteroate synthase